MLQALRVHSFGQPNQPYQPSVFPKRIEPVDGRFWFCAFALLFSKRSNVFSQDLFEQLSRTAFFLKNNNKDGVFLLFLSKNCVTLCNVFFVHQINRLGGWLIWWTAAWWIFFLFFFFGWYGWCEKNGPLYFRTRYLLWLVCILYLFCCNRKS